MDTRYYPLKVTEGCIEDARRLKRHPVDLAMSSWPWVYDPDDPVIDPFFRSPRARSCGIQFTDVCCEPAIGLLDDAGIDWADRFVCGEDVEPVKLNMIWMMEPHAKTVMDSYWTTKRASVFNSDGNLELVDNVTHAANVAKLVKKAPLSRGLSQCGSSLPAGKLLYAELPAPPIRTELANFHLWVKAVKEEIESKLESIDDDVRERMMWEPLALTVWVYLHHQGMSQRDLDNIVKSVQDIFQKAKVCANDSHVWDLVAKKRRAPERHPEGVSVTLRLLDPFNGHPLVVDRFADIYSGKESARLDFGDVH